MFFQLMTINMNRLVRVRLTPEGHRAYEEFLRKLDLPKDNEKAIREKHDDGDAKKFRLWETMMIFGPSISYDLQFTPFEYNAVDVEM